MWSDLIGVYQRHIAEPGKQPLFLLLVGFIGSFLFIRFSVRMIRRGVRWWPGNVTPGGLHIHHVVFGMFFLLVSGIGTFATVGTHPWIDAFAGFFGIGCGLVLDEFALLLHLEDVYWSDQGRKSVDAVIIGIVFTGLLLVGYLPLGYTPGGSGSRGHWGLIGIISLNGACAVLSLLKGKLWTGLIGIMVPGVSWVGAVRLARPFSPWARWVYTRHPRLYGRARRREARWHRRADAVREWVFDVIAGKPTPGATAVQQVTHRVAERMAARMAAHLAHSRARHLARMAARHRLGSTEWPGAVGGGAGLSGGSAFAASARYGPNRPTARRTAVARRRAGVARARARRGRRPGRRTPVADARRGACLLAGRRRCPAHGRRPPPYRRHGGADPPGTLRRRGRWDGGGAEAAGALGRRAPRRRGRWDGGRRDGGGAGTARRRDGGSAGTAGRPGGAERVGAVTRRCADAASPGRRRPGGGAPKGLTTLSTARHRPGQAARALGGGPAQNGASLVASPAPHQHSRRRRRSPHRAPAAHRRAPVGERPSGAVRAAGAARPPHGLAVPGPPSAGQLQAARSAVGDRAAAVAAAQHALDAAQSAAQELDARAELAAQNYDRAVEQRQSAEAAERRAAASAAAAAARRETARAAVAELAAQTYRDGVPASLAMAGALLSSDGLQNAMERRHVVATVARHTESVLEEDTAAAAAARSTAAAARSAADAARRATAEVAVARAEAQRQADAEHQQLAAYQAQQQQALEQLAAAQRISVALASERQQALDEAASRAQAVAQSSDAAETAAITAAPAGAPRGGQGTASGGAAAVAFARAQLGLPYVWGGAGPREYDCSGLTMRAWQRGGVALPRVAADQYSRSKPVGYGQLRPGDLVFWSHSGKPQDIYHVAIYIGGDKMIEAPHTGSVVKVADLFIMGTPDFYGRP